MDIGGLLKPIEDDAPSGPNLEYERAFQDMELAGQYGTETQIGDIVREAQEPDFAKLGKLAREVLDQSHDIRAAVYLAEAVVRTGGLVPFAEVACVKDFPGAWAEYRVFDGGILQVHRRITGTRALEWTERTRGMFGGAYPAYALGRSRDRCFVVRAPSEPT